jgi:hypothetical protein
MAVNKSFLTLAPTVDFIRPFPSMLTDRPNKLNKFFQPSLIFVGKAGRLRIAELWLGEVRLG